MGAGDRTAAGVLHSRRTAAVGWERAASAPDAAPKGEGVDPGAGTPRELRHSFVSLLPDSGVPLEEVSRLVGHKNTTVTELVYRKQLRPVMQGGAVAKDALFPQSRGR